jgi:hypothetical protein
MMPPVIWLRAVLGVIIHPCRIAADRAPEPIRPKSGSIPTARKIAPQVFHDIEGAGAICVEGRVVGQSEFAFSHDLGTALAQRRCHVDTVGEAPTSLASFALASCAASMTAPPVPVVADEP